MQTKGPSGAMRADALKGKRILITGGGTGLGKELARAFSAQGAAVYIWQPSRMLTVRLPIRRNLW